ncbi:MAG: DUF192 domain-containing protein [Elusimicrobiaceae bacterium]|nr:DUF192 domain-containing protein [Elusimicrobiaceae bacterium]
MKCSVKRTATVLAQQVEEARTFWARLKGLMFRRSLSQGSALLLEPCPQIHTCFMRFNIDVVFLDKNNRVVAVLEDVKPWRMTRFYHLSKCTLELPGGSVQGRVQIGDELIFN